jgi:putative SOS response-associated peptidase YedK
MCGRFAQTTPSDDLVRFFRLVMGLDLAPRYNIAPTQDALVIRAHADGRHAHLHRWGLVPPWAKDLKLGARMINARSETIFDKASFKRPVRHQRCVFPVSGFYEWRRTPTGKDPLLFTDPGGAPLPLAGIWSIWRAPDGTEVPTASILTTKASLDLAQIHDRMPVILDLQGLDIWLDPAVSNPTQLRPLMVPAPDHRLHARPLSRHVNSVRNEGPDCWHPPD